MRPVDADRVIRCPEMFTEAEHLEALELRRQSGQSARLADFTLYSPVADDPPRRVNVLATLMMLIVICVVGGLGFYLALIL